MAKIFLNSQECIGCHLCELACSAKTKGIFNPKLAHIKIISNYIKDELVVGFKACSLCNECIAACPQGAITRKNNFLQIDHDKCTSCGICVAECPEGIIKEYNDQVTICDTCNGQPECVAWCPRNALTYGEVG